MKKQTKKLISIIMVIAIILSLTASYAGAETNSEKANKYYAVILGVNIDMFKRAKEDYSTDEIKIAVESVLCSRKYEDEMYNSENNIDVSKVVLSLSISECSELFGITEQEVREHIAICGINVYNSLIQKYIESDVESGVESDVESETYDIQSSGGNGQDEEVQYWNRFVGGATGGNIFITKDSAILGVVFGHVGVIQARDKYDNTIAYITEAVGDKINPAEEVVCRNISTVDHWHYAKTLCSMYPNNNDVNARLAAGNHTLYYAIEDNYTYEMFSTKNKVRQSSYTKVNCASLAYRVYYFIAQFDIIPQVGNNDQILPQQIYRSANMAQKYDSNNNPHKTDNFDTVAWGL